MDSIEKDTSQYPSKKPRKIEALDAVYSVNIIDLFARIPELQYVFSQICDKKFKCYQIGSDNYSNHSVNHKYVKGSKYLVIRDETDRLTSEDIKKLPYDFKEIQFKESKENYLEYRVRYNSSNPDNWYYDLAIYSSPFIRSRIIMLFGDINEFRVISTCLLYALSIIVRYRPSIWRGILNGKEERYLVIIEQFLDVVERVIPEEYLGKVSGKDVKVKLSGSIYS